MLLAFGAANSLLLLQFRANVSPEIFFDCLLADLVPPAAFEQVLDLILVDEHVELQRQEHAGDCRFELVNRVANRILGIDIGYLVEEVDDNQANLGNHPIDFAFIDELKGKPVMRLHYVCLILGSLLKLMQ